MSSFFFLLPSQWVLCFLTAITISISLKATSFLRPCAPGWTSRVIFPMDCSRIPFRLVYPAALSRTQWTRPSGLVQHQVARWPCPGWPEGEVASAPPACAAPPDRDPFPVKPGWCGAAADLSPYTYTAAVDRWSPVNRQHCPTPLSIHPHSNCGQVITGKQHCTSFHTPTQQLWTGDHWYDSYGQGVIDMTTVTGVNDITAMDSGSWV